MCQGYEIKNSVDNFEELPSEISNFIIRNLRLKHEKEHIEQFSAIEKEKILNPYKNILNFNSFNIMTIQMECTVLKFFFAYILKK